MNLASEEEFTLDSGHRKKAVLSAEELFQWRKKEVQPVPQRGGIKDFEPDGSWLQDKWLEAFYEEHLSVLAEPRVEKSGNLVQGTWDSEMKLVNIKKTAKFWMKMGFADSDRNWLHPEEALFLMEVNCLEVVHQSVSLSLQEAYSLLLHPSCSITEEEYQVYAHLRRLGYIVLRHAGKLDITPYEMKIGLHNYSKKKNRKHCLKAKTAQSENPKPSRQMNRSPASKEKQQQDNRCLESYPGKIHMNRSVGNKVKAELTTEAAETDTNGKSVNRELAFTQPHAGSAAVLGGRKRPECKNYENVECERQSDHNAKESPDCEMMTEEKEGDGTDCEMKTEEKKEDGPDCDRLPGDKTGEVSKRKRLIEKSDRQNPKTTELPQLTHGGQKGTRNTEDVDTGSTSREPAEKKARVNSDCETSSVLPSVTDRQYSLDLWSDATERSFSQQMCSSLTAWDFSVLQFPDMGGRDTVCLLAPPASCLPPNTCMEEEYEDVCMFDVEEYRQQQHPLSVVDQEDSSRHLRQLEFSYAEWYKQNFRPLSARNWREWNEGFRQREKSFLYDSPVAHLWQGEVTPLVQPQHADSTDCLLKRLSVIQPYEGPFPAKDSNQAVKISFDVYLPNTTFRKSSPGLPDHRVCIARGSQVPGAFEVHAATGHLDDGVPLHWAVVTSGEVCFFVFHDLDLPVHPSSLG